MYMGLVCAPGGIVLLNYIPQEKMWPRRSTTHVSMCVHNNVILLLGWPIGED